MHVSQACKIKCYALCMLISQTPIVSKKKEKSIFPFNILILFCQKPFLKVKCPHFYILGPWALSVFIWAWQSCCVTTPLTMFHWLRM